MTPISKYTPQELFDLVAHHLFSQGKQSADRSLDYAVSCKYYNVEDGCKCAIGVLIPDESYRLEMDNCTQEMKKALIDKGEYNKHLDLLNKEPYLISLYGLIILYPQLFENYSVERKAYDFHEGSLLWLMNRLQWVHDDVDNWETTEQMIQAFLHIAQTYNYTKNLESEHINTRTVEALFFRDR